MVVGVEECSRYGDGDGDVDDDEDEDQDVNKINDPPICVYLMIIQFDSFIHVQ